MKELYDSFSEYKDNKIFYLSYSPSFVFHWLGEPFIEDNKLPYKENIIHRENFCSDPSFKANNIVSLVSENPSKHIILVGG